MLRSYAPHLPHPPKENHGEKVLESLRQCQSAIFPTGGTRRARRHLHQASSPGRRGESWTADPVGTASPKLDGGDSRSPTTRLSSASGRGAGASFSTQPPTPVRCEVGKACIPFSSQTVSGETTAKPRSREATAIQFSGRILHLRQHSVGPAAPAERIQEEAARPGSAGRGVKKRHPEADRRSQNPHPAALC